MSLPKLTNKQSEIIELLYRYRYLNRVQIQALLGHKDKKTINLWLRDLKAKQYIDWIYSPDDFALKTRPAIYYLALNGVRYLKTIQADDDTPWYPIEDVRKRYKEATRSQTFIDHSMLIADCCIEMIQAGRTTNPAKKSWTLATEADFRHPSSKYYHLFESDLVNPNLIITKRTTKGSGANKQELVSNFMLEVFDATMPRYRIKKRLSNYVEYLGDGEWQDATKEDSPPVLFLVCPRTSDLIYAKRRTRGVLAEEWDEDDGDKPTIQFATVDDLKRSGISGEIWEVT
jgi:hypothetical protein